MPQLPSWSRRAGRGFLGRKPGRAPQGSLSQRFVREWRRSAHFRKLATSAAGLLAALAVGLAILGIQHHGARVAEHTRAQTNLEALGTFENALVESYSSIAPLYVQVGTDIEAIQASGSQCGFYICTADGQELTAYNAQQPFYSASSIKGPYVLSVLSELESPSQLGSLEDSVTLAITESDNNSYISAKNAFGTATINQWLTEAGSSETLGDNWGSYVDLSCEQLADLWVESAAWCLGDSASEDLHDYGAAIFSEPLNSPIAQLPDAVTWSKPGWIATESQNSTVDAGLVVRGGDAYIMAVMTNKGDDFDTLDPLVASLDTLAQQLIEARASRLA